MKEIIVKQNFQVDNIVSIKFEVNIGHSLQLT